jgi:branched-chain amino acid transport system ATP-binding protein
VRLNGADITNEPVSERTHRGLGRAFQLTQLFPNLSVLENVRLAVQSRRGTASTSGRVWLDHRGTLERARELVQRVALGDRADAAASSLPHGDQRKLEVAMLMALEPSVYMFDEPTAGMSVDDVPVILDLIRGLKAEADKTVLLVEHKMDVVRELADRIVVLHNGKLVADGEPEAGDRVAHRAAGLSRPGAGGGGGMSAPLLSLAGVHTHIGAYHILHGVDFEVPAGR